MINPSEVIYREHVAGALFLMGVDEGAWGIRGSLEELVWPNVVLWCKATPSKPEAGADKYYLRFDLDGYPTAAPLATPWDVTKDQMLDRDRWPQWSDHVKEVFKWDWWKKGQGLYAPCDRSIVSEPGGGHRNWQEQHPADWWTTNNSTIVKYLRFLKKTLNGNE